MQQHKGNNIPTYNVYDDQVKDNDEDMDIGKMCGNDGDEDVFEENVSISNSVKRRK